MAVVIPAVMKKRTQLSSPLVQTPPRFDRFLATMASRRETSGTKMVTQNCQDVSRK
jgi:hypothetical protein